ncbi:MAG: hypothetical protein JWN27_3794 [Candidatus Eremiobacteraeota bacterium]|nr:hypothetical protein [Candidatus Eremiobacteraeota bacterium]
MTVFYAIPSWLLLTLAVLVFAALACAGLIVQRRALPKVDFHAHNDVAGLFIGVVAGLFTVTVAFIVAIVWQQFDGTTQRISAEVASAKDLWHVSAGLPAPLRAELRGMLAEYAGVMVTEEWPAMHRGGSSRRAEAIVSQAFEDTARFRPADAGSSTAQSSALRYLSEIHDARHHRLDDNSNGLAPFEWASLLLGAVMVIVLCYMVGLPNIRAHAFMTAVVAAAIASMFVLIFELDYPFRGDVAVPPDLWRGFVRDHPVPHVTTEVDVPRRA